MTTRPGRYFAQELPESAVQPGRKALFLDRDGVINVNHGYVHTPEATDWVPGIFEFCQAAHAAGYVMVVVTNQAGIARGLYSEDVFLGYTRWMHEQFASRGIPLLATFYCPHHPSAGIGDLRQECNCRKPSPGMILEAARMWNLDLGRSVLVGDQPSDMEAARAAGIGACLMIDHQAMQPFEQAFSLLNAH